MSRQERERNRTITVKDLEILRRQGFKVEQSQGHNWPNELDLFYIQDAPSHATNFVKVYFRQR